MRGTETNYSIEIEKTVAEMISNMWNRILAKAEERNTSIASAANRAGINASAVYHSINKSRNDKFNYIDNNISSIFALTEELDANFDEIITGKKSNNKSSNMSNKFKTILKSLSLDRLEELRQNIIDYLQN